MKNIQSNSRQDKRARRVRSKLLDRSDLPRLIVKRSNQHLHAQIVDKGGKVLAAATSVTLKDVTGTKTDMARQVGVKLAESAAKNKIKAAVLDRGHYRFHGRVKALVESLNDSGIKI
ncbi:MAG: 50S ribosomal protein L18 [Patescibacteria group bacterium]